MADRSGTAGNDTLDAGTLGDVNTVNNYRGLAGNDSLAGGALADTLDGEEGDDSIEGGDGADRIQSSGGGSDTLLGEQGDDLVTVESGTFLVSGGQGDDIIFCAGDGSIFGDPGDDVLLHGAGNATLSGGQGDDVLFVREGSRVNFDGGAGEDAVSYDQFETGVRVDLERGGNGGEAAGDVYISVENVTGSGGNDTLIGDGAYNRLQGGFGADVIKGGAGGDFLEGGFGTDTLDYDGSDAGVTIDLSTSRASGGHAEGDRIVSFEKVSGSEFRDVLNGSGAANGFAGRAGNDSLNGRGGADTLSGGTGTDKLLGGTQGDRLLGGREADRFIYTSTSESTLASANRDVIGDFSRTEADRIDLALIDANSEASGNQAFKFIGSGAYTGVAGQLRYALTGDNVLISADVNGDRVADFAILVENFGAMSVNDFVL